MLEDRLGPEWTPEQIKVELANYTYWYHKIALSDGIVTPGMNLEPIWDNIREVRRSISYTGKDVLDIASFDGLFAFEAESLGARNVIATDCLYKSFKNFLFCKQVLGSRVIPYFNISPYDLTERLDVYFDENYEDQNPNERPFDIVQHLGLLEAGMGVYKRDSDSKMFILNKKYQNCNKIYFVTPVRLL